MKTITINTDDPAGRFDMNEAEAKQFFSYVERQATKAGHIVAFVEANYVDEFSEQFVEICFSEYIPDSAKMLMNHYTGSVDTEENWLCEMPTWDDDPAECQRQFDTLVEVVKTENGDWVEA
ncbi:TPA: hypothetical protein ACRR44_005286 [Klebsiella quasipneumoniae]|uniref:hypothetical protein n=1 Tax=Klebsiella quasipneumoniae TaxID=1463165 RepID=UPI00244B05C3|nr:hypothetical protein [Klebsiella quasipneumoniae]MDH1962655.1 hypothetical protein [Klebsiella quasipneumoniae]